MQVESKTVETVPIADQFGRYLIGRGMGAEIRLRFFSGDPSTWPRALDFEGVEQVTESCIDEIFGGLARAYGLETVRKINIRSATPAVEDTIRYVLEILEDPPTRSNAESVLGLLAASRRRSQANRHKGNRTRTPSRAKS
jgi:hypothetical protein